MLSKMLPVVLTFGTLAVFLGGVAWLIERCKQYHLRHNEKGGTTMK